MPLIVILINRRGVFTESERSWQTMSLITSQFSLLALGSRWRVRKWRMGLKTAFALTAYVILIGLFLKWTFRDNRTGIVAYLMLSTISFYGSAAWSLYVSRRGDWGTWRLGESRKYIRRIHDRQNSNSRSEETPFDSSPSDAAPLPVRFILHGNHTIRGESWQGAFVAEFSNAPATVYWPTESKWRRVAPEWALPCWQSTLDQLRIWCDAEDANLQIDDSARIEFA
ncbi:hypothetical protein [Lacipirellula sp.]|uniref:hypothetical protein n=1 Tax=Lacipirellula sp. TaxID=2691419 RepID=UPI003D0E401D